MCVFALRGRAWRLIAVTDSPVPWPELGENLEAWRFPKQVLLLIFTYKEILFSRLVTSHSRDILPIFS